MTVTQLTAAKRIAAVLRNGKREVTPEQAGAFIDAMLAKYRVRYPLAQSDAFAATLADAIEDGHLEWTGAMHRTFGGPL